MVTKLFRKNKLVFIEENGKMYNTILNHHLLKDKPLYKDNNNRIVKLIHMYNTDDGLCFTTQIMEGEDKGKWSQAYKFELERIKL